jgi:hypothetical protein
MKRMLLLSLGALVVCVAGLALVRALTSKTPASPVFSLPDLPPAEQFVVRVDNPYYPLEPGTTFIYSGSKDGKRAVDLFTVTHETKTILGIPAVVVHDRLLLDGIPAENTQDWFAQDRAGNVWYLGEATQRLDAHGRVTSTEGSWQAGVDGARAGIFMPGNPRVGDAYHQELSRGHAEDRFSITSLSARTAVPYGVYDNALRTSDTTPLERGMVGNKYFVAHVGNVRENDVHGGDEYLDLVAVLHAADGQ